jgi:hypothetical protein
LVFYINGVMKLKIWDSWTPLFIFVLQILSKQKSLFANQCVNRLPIAILNPWSLNHAIKMIIQVCSKVHVLFPLAVCLFKLHLNHPAILTPDPAHF